MVEVGDAIVIISMDGEPQHEGKIGRVTSIDDMGQLHGTWGGCAIIPNLDSYRVIQKGDKR